MAQVIMVSRKLDAKQLKVLNEPQFVHPLRYRTLKKAKIGSGPVLYWMSRDQRAKDNWALRYAQELALNLKRPLWVVFCLVPRFLEATLRQYAFMLRGLAAAGKTLIQHNINFFVLSGEPAYEIPLFINRHDIAILVADFDPLKIKRQWAEKVQENINIDFYSAKDALKIAIYLNDRYELDGRDPNGYAGIAWSICGVHDRPWRERPIFGKIRYMSYQGCARKFD
ncbi:MAG: deoxyribodipyrimidine photo-lyase, partial [bacterium]